MKVQSRGLSKWVVVGLMPVLMTFVQAMLPGRQTNPPAYTPDHYGLVYPHSYTDWEPDDIDDMAAVLRWAKVHGVNTVIQTFPAKYVGRPESSRWVYFLDLAESYQIDVMAYLWPNKTYTPPDGVFYFDELKAFLDVVGDHPALIGYIGLHEPLEPEKGLTDVELRAYYAEMKGYAPHLKIAHYLGNIARAEALRPDGWKFSDGMCDICILWYFPCRYDHGVATFLGEGVTEVIALNRTLMDERDADAELWFLGQAFEQVDYPTPLRFPVPEEMLAIYELANQNRVEAFMWYAWEQSDIYDIVLGDPGMEAQQEMVGTIAWLYVIQQKAFVPIVGGDLSTPERPGMLAGRR